MFLQAQLAEIIDIQQAVFKKRDLGVERENLNHIPIVENFATIITGLRRCGKSTALLQLREKKFPNGIYLNFEDIRLANFDSNDFIRLHREFIQREISVLIFDEIQLIRGWELYVHQLLNENFQVFITGSNASLLSKEMGTHLTGRNLPMEFFPFSFSEFCEFSQLQPNNRAAQTYLHNGGMPEFVKAKNPVILQRLVDDILYRDIAARFNIRDVDALRQLTVYLFSNVGKPISANKMSGMFGIKAPSTFLEYFSYLQNVYLLEFIPKFSYSLKKQARNNKKVYAIDNGMVIHVSHSFSGDYGRKLENLAYTHLRRFSQDIFYHQDKSECDFLITHKGKPKLAFQVCHNITEVNFERERKGVLEAMETYNLNFGYIITLQQSDEFEFKNKVVKMIPLEDFLLTDWGESLN